MQSLQQLVKRLIVLRRVLVPADEIPDDFANDIRFPFVFPLTRMFRSCLILPQKRGISTTEKTFQVSET